jgi:hypothetical protein
MLAMTIPWAWQPQLISESESMLHWQLHAEHIDSKVVIGSFPCAQHWQMQKVTLCEVTHGWWSYQQLEPGQHYLTFTRKTSQPRVAIPASLKLVAYTALNQHQIDGYLLTLMQSSQSLDAVVGLLQFRYHHRQPQLLRVSPTEGYLTLQRPLENLLLAEQRGQLFIVSLVKELEYGR